MEASWEKWESTVFFHHLTGTRSRLYIFINFFRWVIVVGNRYSEVNLVSCVLEWVLLLDVKVLEIIYYAIFSYGYM